MAKTAVILMNLGGPDCRESIRPFLMNFFMDPNILRVPIPFRCFLAALIARKRTKKEAGESYGELGDKSPLLENTKAQAKALQKALGKDFSVHIHMRYWHPLAPHAVYNLREEAPDRVILLPLYPQYSTTTTRSSLNALAKAMREQGFTDTPIDAICCYPFNKGFIEASADLVRTEYKKMKNSPRLLFSAHGLPESVIKDGDPYQWQCEESARLIAEATGINNLDWQICYQSRVGPQKWIGPSTEEALEQAAKDGKAVLIYPHAFVSEHVETLVELDVEYKEVAEEHGIHADDYGRVPTVSTHPGFIEGLADMVKLRLGKGCGPDSGTRLCPSGYQRCCLDQNSEVDLNEESLGGTAPKPHSV